MQMADIMASEGYLEAGYSMVSLDDCWLARERDADGKLQPDSDRFPSGIAALADYVRTLVLNDEAIDVLFYLCLMPNFLYFNSHFISSFIYMFCFIQ